MMHLHFEAAARLLGDFIFGRVLILCGFIYCIGLSQLTEAHWDTPAATVYCKHFTAVMIPLLCYYKYNSV